MAGVELLHCHFALIRGTWGNRGNFAKFDKEKRRILLKSIRRNSGFRICDSVLYTLIVLVQRYKAEVARELMDTNTEQHPEK